MAQHWMRCGLVFVTGIAGAVACGDDSVSVQPGYSLALGSSARSIYQGADSTIAVILTRTDFTGAVTLSLGGAPAGVTGSFNPAAPTDASSILTVSVGAAVAPGDYRLTVAATATAGDRSRSFTLTVIATPDYALALASPALTILQGADGGTPVTLTRTNFSGAVSLSLSGAPAGVTGSFNPVAPTGTSSTLTVSVSGLVAPGVYNLTVDGTGTAGHRSTPLTLTVAAAPPSYALSITPATLRISAGADHSTTVALARINFTGPVTLSLGNAPAGVTGSFSPAAPTDTSSILTVSVGPAVAPAVYSLTVDGTGTGGNRSTPLTLTVDPLGSGNVVADFSTCVAAERPVWLASQDGAGAWSVVTSDNGVYHFNVASGRGGLAFVLSSAGVSTTTVQYMTQAEFTDNPVVYCPATPAGKTINGTAAGISVSDEATISLGGASAFPTSRGPSFQLTGVASGNQDLVAYLYNFYFDEAIIRRDLNIADNGSLARVDFSANEAFFADYAIITPAGLLGGETVRQSMFYLTGPSCTVATLYAGAFALPFNSGYLVSGIPAAQQRASDFHGLSVSATTRAGASRSITEYFHTLSDRTVTLGLPIPVPAVTSLGGPYKRLQAAYTLPVDYNTSTSFLYNTAGRSVNLTATTGYLGGTATTLALADYSALAGWDNNWVPASASTGPWTASGSGSNVTTSVCVENASIKTASVSGTF
jgi:hypothetical protein